MASPLIPGLSFRADDDEVDGSRTFLPAAGQMLLVTDDLASTADFLLHSGLVQHLKANGSRAVLVSSNDVLHWKNVSAKMGCNLSSHLQSGSVVLVNPAMALLRSLPTNAESAKPMNAVYDDIKDKLSFNASRETVAQLLILDDMFSLEWSGIPSFEIIRFSRAMHALAVATRTGIIVRYHGFASQVTTSPILRHLMETCHAHVEVRSLASGRSGAVSGEVSLHPGMALVDPILQGAKMQPTLYRLGNAGPEYFGRGIGGGVL